MSISWSRVRYMLVKEWVQMFRDPRMKPIVFVAPIVQLLLFGYAVNTDVRETTTIILDQDRTQESRRLISQLTASGYFRVTEYATSGKDIVAALDGGRAIVGLEIPPGFSADLLAGRGPDLQILVDGTNPNTGTVAQAYAGRIIQDYAKSFAPPGAPTGVDLRTRAWFNPDLASRTYNVPGVIGLLLLLMCLLLTSLAIVREREIGTLDQLLVSPLTPAEFILGKTIPVALVGVIDLVLITSVAILWFDIPFHGSIFTLGSAALLFIVAGLSCGLYISSISHTQQEAFMTMFLFVLPAIILSGFLYPITSMPLPFQWMTVLNPVRHFLEIVRAVFLKGTGWSELWVQFSTLAAMAGIGLVFATDRFRRSIW
jgi:ABC-2 type transport system permease protein